MKDRLQAARWVHHRGCGLVVILLAVLGSASRSNASDRRVTRETKQWIGTWAAAAQPAVPDALLRFENQTVRLIVHTSAGGKQVRIRLANTFGEQPLVIGGAHIARRSVAADIGPTSDRRLTFQGRPSIRIARGAMAVSDPVALDVAALSDLTISLFFPESTKATTAHVLALETNYVSVSSASGDSTAAVKFPVGRTIESWPFLTGVDVQASRGGAAIVAFGSSLTDGDGSTKDANRRWPDLLAERLQKSGGHGREVGVLNEGLIGNRLLSDSRSPRQTGGPAPPLGAVFQQLGPTLGQAGLVRFDRDVLAQPGVKYVIVGLGVNDILFPGSFIPERERVNARSLISGNRRLIARAHSKGIKIIGTTIPPFEHASWSEPFFDRFYSPEKEKVRQAVNQWIRRSGEFDGLIDFDEAVRDPGHPSQLLPAFDSGDHLHVNDQGNVAQANAIPLGLFVEH